MSEALDVIKFMASAPTVTRWRRPKYKPGTPFSSVDDLLQHCHRGGWVYCNGNVGIRRPYHPSMIMCWQLGTIANFLRHGALARAEEWQ